MCHIGGMPAPTRELTKPTTGTYSTRFVKGGPAVPVRVTIIADDTNPDGWKMQAVVDGKPLGYAYSQEEVNAKGMVWVMGGPSKEESTPADRLMMSIMIACCGSRRDGTGPISEAEYERMLELRRTTPAWHPCHHPYEAIDTTKLPVLGSMRRRL